MPVLAVASPRRAAVTGRRRLVRRSKPIRARTARERQRTQQEYVPSPTPGTRDLVHRVIATVDLMWRSRQIGDRQHKAALRFRDAFDQLTASPGGSMDLDRVRGKALPGQPPSLAEFEAADIIREAKMRLYPSSFRLMVLVVGEGRTIKETAVIVGTSSKEAGWELRLALNNLADAWVQTRSHGRAPTAESKPIAVLPASKPPTPRRYELFERNFDHRTISPDTVTTSTTQPRRVAHADRHGVKMSGR